MEAASLKTKQGNQLIFLGVLLFLLGLLVGLIIPLLANPRMGLSSHLEGVMNGMFLMILGLIWNKIDLSPRWTKITFWMAIYGTFANWFGILFAAIFDAGEMLGIAAEGNKGTPLAEGVVTFSLLSLTIAMLFVCIAILVGLRKGLFSVSILISLTMGCMSNDNKVPENIDHLVYTAPSLEQGMEEIENLLGVKPVIGGRHPNYGTHNALLSLGKSTYLEIIAPDPELPAPENGRWLAKQYQQKPKLTTWVLRQEQIESIREKAVQNGLPLGEVESGKREKPDGTVLAWKLTDPYAFPLDGTIPFLISWGETPHPAKAVPRAGELIAFEIEHPTPQKVMESLKVLGVDVKVTQSNNPKITAVIKTEKGIVTLQ